MNKSENDNVTKQVAEDVTGNEAGKPTSQSRRSFLGGVGASPLAVAALGVPLAATTIKEAEAGDEVSPFGNNLAARTNEAFQIRRRAALRERQRNQNRAGADNFRRTHENNGDEENLEGFIGNFHKGLKQNDLGEVDPAAYNQLLTALGSGKFEDLAKVELGCPDPTLQRRLVNPLAGLAFQGLGPDSHAQVMPPAPSFSSEVAAAEMVENYWSALMRDIPFDQYEGNPMVEAAAAELTSLPGFQGLRDLDSNVTFRELFRSGLPGSEVGPYASQFFLMDVPYGVQGFSQQFSHRVEGLDFMTTYENWLDIQRGCARDPGTDIYDPVRRYYYNGRVGSSFVQIDALAQAYFNACVIALTPPTTIGQFGMNAGFGGLGVPFDPNNPYFGSNTGGGVGDPIGFTGAARISEGLATFGPPQILTLLWAVSGFSAQNQWFQKWNVHRRLRPEAFGGRIHNHMTGAASYPIHESVLNSKAVAETFSRNGTYLLPMAFPEGSPTHPAYGAGHATVAGACVTILKAVFDEDAIIENPVQPSADGRTLVPYIGGDTLTVGGELNKLAGNVGCARNFGCVHYRSDNADSYRLGEEYAIQFLRDLKETAIEPFDGYKLTTFDGVEMIV